MFAESYRFVNLTANQHDLKLKVYIYFSAVVSHFNILLTKQQPER